MLLQTASKAFTKIFGSRNERLVKAYLRRVAEINALEPQVRILTDPELRDRVSDFRDRIADGQRVSALLPQIMAVAREVMDRSVGIRNVFNPEHAAAFAKDKLPPDIQAIHEQITAQCAALPPAPVQGGEPAPAWQQVQIPPAFYEAVRAIYPKSRPPFRARPFDVQLIGGMVLGEGRISEMKTGEGKTIVAPLACFVACMEGLQCHVVTVNDYLVQRDRDWVFPFYLHLGLTVGAIHPYHMQPPELKAQAYHCNVVYGTNSEFGFDYLRDNMKLALEEQVQKKRDFCIVDEIDSILIDEARTPLIISGPAHDDAPRYGLADQLARHLMQCQRQWDTANDKVVAAQMRIKGLEGDIRNARDKSAIPPMREEMKALEKQVPDLEADRDQYVQYYEIEREKKAAHLTHEGIAEAQKIANIGSFYVGNNIDVPHLLENALRAHVIYQRDKDYVVQGGEVVIVDEFTGRLMIGRQWSDGLHQAVEAKEKVKIKQETQTLATVTIQNFFKLYKRLAGMTGTAITEATEFYEIYKLDVVCIPTNVAVVRIDRDDLVFLSEKDKWNAILDEIKRIHDLGRPVLVGTTSVENSEMLAQRLAKKHGIHHEVLNAKQHEREAHIVEHAGQLGAVMIATNMAGRGTDIKLQPIDRSALVRHWQQRNLLSRDADPAMSDGQLINLAYRHMARVQLGMKPKEVEELSDEAVKLALLRYWVRTNTWHDEKKAQAMTAEQCIAVLDQAPDFLIHRLQIYAHIEQMGGLHIVGTERHEARRIDNQLRGRAGRQGDQGSSRFFISLEDPLMKMFAGKTTMAALSRLGMKEGDAIEHRWITKSVARAQKKVEERNYEIRKNLLEYDEVMEHQRNAFYGIRQDVLQGKNIQSLIFDYIGDSVDDAVALYMEKEYVQTQVAEWCRQKLDVSVEPEKLYLGNLKELTTIVRREARGEARAVIDVTLGEYMSHDVPPEEWDLRGLQHWAMSRFSVNLSQNQIRALNVDEVKTMLMQAADEQIDKKELTGLEKFIDPHYAQRDLANWAQQKFGIELDAAQLAQMEDQAMADQILAQARERYVRREVAYPCEYVLEAIFQIAQQDAGVAVSELVRWVAARYGLQWTAEDVTRKNGQELLQFLTAEQERWLTGGQLQAHADQVMAQHGHDAQALHDFLKERWGQEVDLDELEDADAPARRELVMSKARATLRAELTQLERFVLLQILDAAWKDHLYAMDQLKGSVSLRSYAERDPRIEYKREGARLFREMQKLVRYRVAELIFRARLTPNVQVRNVYQQPQATQASTAGSGATSASAAAAAGTAQQRADLDAANRASGGGGASGGGDGAGDRHLSRKQRRAQAAQARKGDTDAHGKDRKPRGR
jgi:preprotein translocase subunit SecA